MKKYEVEMAIIENGTITGWDSDAVQDYVEATDAEDAMNIARDYFCEYKINNRHFSDKEDSVLRAREVIDASCGDYGEWFLNILSPRIKPNVYARPSIYKMLTLMFNVV